MNPVQDVVRLPKSPGNRKAPKAPPKKPCAPSVYKGEAQEMKLLKEMFKLCSSSGNLSFVLADLKKRPLVSFTCVLGMQKIKRTPVL